MCYFVIVVPVLNTRVVVRVSQTSNMLINNINAIVLILLKKSADCNAISLITMLQ